uniref:Glycos_transf_2 n=1 Tax=uncultured Leadbetterella sp. TaxID=543029 RepID=A0A060CRN6_9BACT|nr:Glycos_transf_2 [uncultured Leadbetterella sp.]
MIFEQDVLNKIEIIIVENTSSDGTAERCKELVEKNRNVYLYHSEKGVSNARNKGVENAKGKWIFL